MREPTREELKSLYKITTPSERVEMCIVLSQAKIDLAREDNTSEEDDLQIEHSEEKKNIINP